MIRLLYPFKASTLLSLSMTLMFLASAIVVIVSVNAQKRDEAIKTAEAKAQILLDQNLATHAYFTEQVKPKLFDLIDLLDKKDYFEPVWMSSTHAVRQIHNHFKSINQSDYYYKECAIQARSLENEADNFERAFIEQLNRRPELHEWSDTRTLDGKDYFVLIKRGETMEMSCLRCHSTPDQAPAQLVERYGPDRSFNRTLGEVVSAISIRIPIAQAYSAAARSSIAMSLEVLALMAIIFVVQRLLSHYLILKPLTLVQNKAKEIAGSPERLGENIPRPRGKELQALVDAFNEMSANLKISHETLEQRVKVRTEALIRAKERAEAAASAKNEFLANMSHEIRTPMNSILGFTEILLEEELGDEQRDMLQIVHDNGNHLLELLNDILDFTKIEADKLEIEIIPCSLEDLLERLRSLNRLAAEEKGLAFEVSVAPDTPMRIHTDPSRLMQCLINLTSNAVKFTHWGQVRVQAAGVDRNGCPCVCFEVHDTGIGIPEDKQAAVFEAFTQADGSTSRRYGGTGLGLTITKKLASLLGGELTFTSRSGKGSVFSLTIPVNKETAALTSADEKEAFLKTIDAVVAEIEQINALYAGCVPIETPLDPQSYSE